MIARRSSTIARALVPLLALLVLLGRPRLAEA
jgi:hypothetical protein